MRWLLLVGAIYFGVALVGVVASGGNPVGALLCTLAWAWMAGYTHAQHRAERKAKQKRPGTEL